MEVFGFLMYIGIGMRGDSLMGAGGVGAQKKHKRKEAGDRGMRNLSDVSVLDEISFLIVRERCK